MKFTITALTILATVSGSNAVNSPYVTCCEDSNGKYKNVNGKYGQYGVCQKDRVNTEDKRFYEDNCDNKKKMYHVFALNNCEKRLE